MEAIASLRVAQASKQALLLLLQLASSPAAYCPPESRLAAFNSVDCSRQLVTFYLHLLYTL